MQDQPVVIRRYAKSRLYDAAAARYRSLDDLHRWAAAGIAFVVVDSETGKDVTRVLLA
jgi:polyhydroxyalkanoate synthesis regulator protein